MEELIEPAETIDADLMLSSALQKFEEHELLIVTRKGRYAGELHPGMLLRFKGDAEQVRIAKVAKKGSVISQAELRYSSLQAKFSKGRMRWLAVLDEFSRPQGVVPAARVLAASADAFSGRRVREFAEPLREIDANMPADKAEEMMVRGSSEELAVLEGGRLLGILRARDLAAKVKPYLHKRLHEVKQREREDVEKERVASVLTPEFEMKKVRADAEVGQVLEGLDAEGAYAFEGEKLVGKVSVQKMLAALKVEPAAAIEISGLGGGEEMLKESIFGECMHLLRKFGKGGRIALRVKSSLRGKGKKIYEVHGRLEIGNRSFVCSTPEMREHRQNWDLGAAVAEVLSELEAAYLKVKKR